MSSNQPPHHTAMVVILIPLIPDIIPQSPTRQSLMMIFVEHLPLIQQPSQSMKSNAYAENWPKLHLEIFHPTLASQANQLQSAAINYATPTHQPIRSPYIIYWPIKNCRELLQPTHLPRLGRNKKQAYYQHSLKSTNQSDRFLMRFSVLIGWRLRPIKSSISSNRWKPVLCFTVHNPAQIGNYLTWMKWVIIYE